MRHIVAWAWRSPHMVQHKELPNITAEKKLIDKVIEQGWDVEEILWDDETAKVVNS